MATTIGASGLDRFVGTVINLDDTYKPYPMQYRFHESAAPYKCLGGAAGPGKTLALIMEHMIACQEFSKEDAQHVHTLMLRRTHPKLEATLITRFEEKIPRELYTKFNRSDKVVTWLNGATTNFGSMQHEHDAYEFQGQWFKISFDEMAEFTYKQWTAVSAWNRCPVSKYCTKDGATNPIGIGAGWIRKLFVDHRPCDEMDDAQRAMYRAEDYAYFPCTYLDNPVYANDPQFLKNLMSYPKAIRDALMNGSWDVVGGYFYGAFDAAENICLPVECQPEPWHRRWISGDWGFEHFAAIYWHYMDDYGVIRTYKERLVKHHDPEMLAELVVRESQDEDGTMPRFISFPFSHDAFADQATKSYGANPNSVAQRMSRVMQPYALPLPMNSGKDKIGREQTMYNCLRKRIPAGRTETGEPIMRPQWIISDECPALIDCISRAPRDEKKVEEIASFLGDDPLQGAGYGLYHIIGKPAAIPAEELLRKKILASSPEVAHQLRYAETMRRQKKSESKPYWE